MTTINIQYQVYPGDARRGIFCLTQIKEVIADMSENVTLYYNPLYAFNFFEVNLCLTTKVMLVRTACLSGAPAFTAGFQWGSCYSIFIFMCNVLHIVGFFCWPLCCLSVFDLRILITCSVSTNSSYHH